MPPGVGSQRFPIWTERYEEMQSNAMADQIDSGQPYPLRAMLAAGLDVQFFPNSARFVEMLHRLDFICVSDYFPTPGTRLADIVLPIASWLERPMLFPDMMGIVRLCEPPIAPVGECRSEWDIYASLAERLGFGELFWHGDFKACVNHIVAPMNITYEDLQQHPEGFPKPDAPKAEKYYEQAGFGTPSGKVEIASTTLALHGLEPLPAYREMLDNLDEKFPLVFTSGARVLAYTHSQFRQVPSLRKLTPEPVVDINPADAAPRGIKTGDAVTVSSPRGSIRMKADVTDTILPGVVNMLHGWPDEANVNLLVDDRNLDPISGFPPYKSQACQVTKA
jgi:anaerobic selenocysteine-containing dehydrogenase